MIHREPSKGEEQVKGGRKLKVLFGPFEIWAAYETHRWKYHIGSKGETSGKTVRDRGRNVGAIKTQIVFKAKGLDEMTYRENVGQEGTRGEKTGDLKAWHWANI